MGGGGAERSKSNCSSELRHWYRQNVERLNGNGGGVVQSGTGYSDWIAMPMVSTDRK